MHDLRQGPMTPRIPTAAHTTPACVAHACPTLPKRPVGNCDAASPTTSAASRVLPQPPRPVNVTRASAQQVGNLRTFTLAADERRHPNAQPTLHLHGLHLAPIAQTTPSHALRTNGRRPWRRCEREAVRRHGNATKHAVVRIHFVAAPRFCPSTPQGDGVSGGRVVRALPHISSRASEDYVQLSLADRVAHLSRGMWSSYLTTRLGWVCSHISTSGRTSVLPTCEVRDDGDDSPCVKELLTSAAVSPTTFNETLLPTPSPTRGPLDGRPGAPGLAE